MGLIIRLEGENGGLHQEVYDPKNFIIKAINNHDVSKTFCLQFIDPYGDTIFNQLQVIRLKKELMEIRNKTEHEEQLNLFIKIEEMIENCLLEPHRYIKFYGD
jgi:hypothetical protein